MENKTLNLNADAIRAANNASQFDAGDALAREAHSVYENGLHAFETKDDWTPEQIAYAARRADEWRGLVESAYNDLLRRRSSWVPVTVAGPSNYPAAKMQKRCDAEMNAAQEWQRKMDAFCANTAKALEALVPVARQVERYRKGCSDPISADDPAALEELSARLEYLKEDQAHMKALNAWFRKHGTCKGFDGLSDETAARLDDSVKAGYSWEKAPYPSYHLSNNNANIKRIEARVKALQTARERFGQDDGPEEYDGLTIRNDVESNRIQLFFVDKPDADTRALLKSHGFRWSPKAGAWQRQLNGNGLYAARAIVKKLGLTRQDDAQEITLDEFAARVGL